MLNTAAAHPAQCNNNKNYCTAHDKPVFFINALRISACLLYQRRPIYLKASPETTMQIQQNVLPLCPLEGQKPPQQNMPEYKLPGSWAISYLIFRYSLALPLSACRDRYVTTKGHGKVFPARLARLTGKADLFLLNCLVHVSQAPRLVSECPLPPSPQGCEAAANEAEKISGISVKARQQSAPHSSRGPVLELRPGLRVSPNCQSSKGNKFGQRCHQGCTGTGFSGPFPGVTVPQHTTRSSQTLA